MVPACCLSVYGIEVPKGSEYLMIKITSGVKIKRGEKKGKKKKKGFQQRRNEPKKKKKKS